VPSCVGGRGRPEPRPAPWHGCGTDDDAGVPRRRQQLGGWANERLTQQMPDTSGWTADQSVSECELCSARFSFTRRRHHCRACGGVFCAACSRRRLVVAGQEKSGASRVCDPCWKQLAPVPAAAAAARSSQPAPVGSSGDPHSTAAAARSATGESGAAPHTPSPEASAGGGLPTGAPSSGAGGADGEQPAPSPLSVFSSAMFFVAVQRHVVTATFEVDSHEVDTLEVGQVVEALQTRIDDGSGGSAGRRVGVGVRLHIGNGWVTQRSSSGRSMLRRVRGKEVRETMMVSALPPSPLYCAAWFLCRR
jgi:hypothetical protein